MRDYESKSQRKRELEALHKLGEQLGQLADSQLKSFDLPDHLAEALNEVKRIRSNIAKKRQYQYIGGILRDLEPEELDSLRTTMDTLKQTKAGVDAHFHTIERWRDRFLSNEADVLTQFLNEYSCDDIQQLRQTIGKAQREHAKQQNLGGAKALFRLLKSIIDQ